jgi:uncharacterized membrane protein YqgA involved in biofilm formation
MDFLTMPGIGTIVNVLLIFGGGFIGLLLKKLIPDRVADILMTGIGLAVVFIGFSGAIKASLSIVDGAVSVNYTMELVLSLAVGAVIGELVGIEKALERFGEFCGRKLSGGRQTSFSTGFVYTTLLSCIGAMAIVGSIEDGINHNPSILFAKCALDGLSAMVFASSMGSGVPFSGVSVGVYQGLMTLLAVLIAPFLTPDMIAQLSLVGSMLIFSIGLNLLKVTKIKIGNLLPAIFMPPVLALIKNVLGI